MIASGVRNSCARSATNARRWRSVAASRALMPWTAARLRPAATRAEVPGRAIEAPAIPARSSRSSPRIREAVADAEDGEQVAGIVGLRLDLPAQVLDVGIDGAFVRFDGHAMNRAEQLGARKDAPRLASHGRQQLELGLGQLDGPSRDGQLHARQIEFEVTDPNQVARRLGRFA